jgi:hypothetical protein
VTDTSHTTPDNTTPAANPPETPEPAVATPATVNPFRAVIETVLVEHPEWRSAALERTGFDFWAGSEACREFRVFVVEHGLRYTPRAPRDREAA